MYLKMALFIEHNLTEYLLSKLTAFAQNNIAVFHHSPNPDVN